MCSLMTTCFQADRNSDQHKSPPSAARCKALPGNLLDCWNEGLCKSVLPRYDRGCRKLSDSQSSTAAASPHAYQPVSGSTGSLHKPHTHERS